MSARKALPALYDKWHHPPSRCWGPHFIITRSPFLAPSSLTFNFEDEEIYEKANKGTYCVYSADRLPEQCPAPCVEEEEEGGGSDCPFV